MKLLLFVAFVGMVGVSTGAIVRSRRASPPASNDRDAVVLRFDSDVNVDGFNYAYETNNGIAAQATGALKGDAINVKGQYAYTSPEGVPVQVSYTADEEGYKPVGDHLPVPPPTPEAILRGLKYIADHPPPVDTYRKP